MTDNAVPDIRHVLPDVVVLSALPLLLAILHFALPSTVVEQFVFHFYDPSILAAWTSAFLHADAAHLRSNILGYVLAIAPTYVLYLEWERRRAFWTTVVVLVISTPFVTTAIDYALLHLHWGLTGRDAISRGFSGIASAFGGMLLATIGVFLADEYTRMTAWNATMLVVLFSLSILSVTTGAFSPTIAGLLVVGVGLLSTQFFSREDITNPRQLGKRFRGHWQNLLTVTYCGAVVALIVVSIFPSDVVQDGAFVNIFAHASGFLLGILATVLVSISQIQISYPTYWF